MPDPAPPRRPRFEPWQAAYVGLAWLLLAAAYLMPWT